MMQQRSHEGQGIVLGADGGRSQGESVAEGGLGRRGDGKYDCFDLMARG